MRSLPLGLALTLLVSCASTPSPTTSIQPVRTTTASGGHWQDGVATVGPSARAYKLWVPARYNGKTPLPLVVMLHGCTQDPADFAAGTQMNQLADEQSFLVAYPDQPRTANANKCWNWFQPEDQQRGAGEPALLARVVQSVQATHRVKATRVYVAGLSAGAAMAVVLGATYPDVFAAVGVSAGLEYRAGTDLASALNAQLLGGPDPEAQGAAAHDAMGGAKSGVPVIVFHGSADTTVAPVNAEQVIRQWAQTNDLVDDALDNDSVTAAATSVEAGQVPGGRAYTRTTYQDASGRALLEGWLVQDMRHAWSGGSGAGTYTDPLGPNASREMWRFFGQWTLGD